MSKHTKQSTYKSSNNSFKSITQNDKGLPTSGCDLSCHLDLNIIEFKGLHRDVQNSNLSKRNSMKSSDEYFDQDLERLINDLINKVANTDDRIDCKQTKPTKLHKFSSPFMLKNSLNNSIVSTSASDDNNSCERSNSDLSCKEIRSDSLIEEYFSNSLNGDSTEECLEKIFNFPEEENKDNAQDLIGNNEYHSDDLFVITEDEQIDFMSQPINAKKAIITKYKTEICRNWEVEGFCKFGEECIFAHGSHELNKKNSITSNYKTKICKQFTEYPFYCSYGEKCQFVHLSYNTGECSPKKQTKYSFILKETLRNIDKRITNMNFIDAAEEPVSLYKNSRLKVFRDLTENCKEDEKNQQLTPFETSCTKPIKKTALNKMSKVFIMPKTKASLASNQPDPRIKGMSLAQKSTQPGF